MWKSVPLTSGPCCLLLSDTKKGRYSYAKRFRCIRKTKQLKSSHLSLMRAYPKTATREIEEIAQTIKNLFLSCGTYDERFFEELPKIENAFLVRFLCQIDSTWFVAQIGFHEMIKSNEICCNWRWESKEIRLYQINGTHFFALFSFLLNFILWKQEQKKLESKVFGQMQPLPLNEYLRIFHLTGMDVDNRQKALTKRYQSYTRRLETYISFARKLHGFRELCPADQISVLKGTRSCKMSCRFQIDPTLRISHLHWASHVLRFRFKSGTCNHLRKQGLQPRQRHLHFPWEVCLCHVGHVRAGKSRLRGNLVHVGQ